MRIFVLICFACITHQVFAQLDIKQKAHHFIESYQSREFEKMSSFYSAEVKFQDPTLAYFGRTVSIEGKEKVKRFFSQNLTDHFTKIHMDIQSEFSTANYVVVNLIYNSNIRGDYFGAASNKFFKVKIPMTIVLHFNDSGKIISHSDYVDYQQYMKQVEEQK